MITWMTLMLWATVLVMVSGAKDGESAVENAGRCLAVALYAVPAIYATGWLLLPAYGVFHVQ